MPAVDPMRLARELESLAGLVQDSAETTRACLNLLDFYADRTRRPTLATTADLEPKFGVPAPVMRQLSHRVAQAAHDLPDAGDLLADALWESGYRETRLTAAAIFEARVDDGVPSWVEEHAISCSDAVVLNALGGQSLRSWRAAEPDVFLTRVWSWMDSSRAHLPTVALIALSAAISRPEFTLEPELFQGLERRLDQLAAHPRGALRDLVSHLALRSPAETAQMLKDQMVHGAKQREVFAVVRSALPDFPPRHRKVLEAALSADGPA